MSELEQQGLQNTRKDAQGGKGDAKERSCLSETALGLQRPPEAELAGAQG